MSGKSHNFKLCDGYLLDTNDGYGYTSNWVDVSGFELFSVSAVFTGGSPSGVLKLQQSNDLQWSGTGSPVRPLHVGLSTAVNDAADVPSGTGQCSVSISGSGAYVLNQYRAPFRWFRVVYSANANANCSLDIFVTLKSG